MNVDFLTVGLSTLGSLVAVLSGPLLSWYKTRKQVEGEAETRENKHELDATGQALAAYQTLIITLTGQMERMAERLQSMEDAHLKCQEENAKLRVSVEASQKETELMRAESEKLRACVEALETKVETLSQRLQAAEDSKQK